MAKRNTIEDSRGHHGLSYDSAPKTIDDLVNELEAKLKKIQDPLEREQKVHRVATFLLDQVNGDPGPYTCPLCHS